MQVAPTVLQFNADGESIARRWAQLDAAGGGAGDLSPADSLLFNVGGAIVGIHYSRPAKRGRVIWGGIVPFDAIWRLGANFATQFTTDADVIIGETVVPAGEYTLCMLPSATAPQLVVSRSVRVFGTQYDPAKDFVRIPRGRSPFSRGDRHRSG